MMKNEIVDKLSYFRHDPRTQHFSRRLNMIGQKRKQTTNETTAFIPLLIRDLSLSFWNWKKNKWVKLESVLQRKITSWKISKKLRFRFGKEINGKCEK